MQQIEPITDYLKRKLKDAGAARFEAIAAAAGVNASFIRKFFYGSRENPRVQTIQPLIDYFRELELAQGHVEPAQAAIKTVVNEQVSSKSTEAETITDELLSAAAQAGLIERRSFVRRAEDRAMREALKTGKVG